MWCSRGVQIDPNRGYQGQCRIDPKWWDEFWVQLLSLPAAMSADGAVYCQPTVLKLWRYSGLQTYSRDTATCFVCREEMHECGNTAHLHQHMKAANCKVNGRGGGRPPNILRRKPPHCDPSGLESGMSAVEGSSFLCNVHQTPNFSQSVRVGSMFVMRPQERGSKLVGCAHGPCGRPRGPWSLIYNKLQADMCFV